MPAWKVLLIALLATICMALLTATIIVPLNFSGNERWAWMGGLIAATIVATILFVLYLRHADRGMDQRR